MYFTVCTICITEQSFSFLFLNFVTFLFFSGTWPVREITRPRQPTRTSLRCRRRLSRTRPPWSCRRCSGRSRGSTTWPSPEARTRSKASPAAGAGPLLSWSTNGWELINSRVDWQYGGTGLSPVPSLGLYHPQCPNACFFKWLLRSRL